MRIAIISDAWHPQINGVVRTLERLVTELKHLEVEAVVVGPDRFRNIPCPTYPDIRLALTTHKGLGAAIDAARPSAIHIATEGPLGWAARAHCRKHGMPFTTAYHTRFPEYVQARTRLPVNAS